MPDPLPVLTDIKLTRIGDLKPFQKGISCKVLVIKIGTPIMGGL